MHSSAAVDLAMVRVDTIPLELASVRAVGHWDTAVECIGSWRAGFQGQRFADVECSGGRVPRPTDKIAAAGFQNLGAEAG